MKARKKAAPKRAIAAQPALPKILFPTEKSTIGRNKIKRAVKAVLSRRS